MTAYRFCRSDDVPLIVEAYERCNVGAGARPFALTVEHMKRLGREVNLWTSSCMVAFEGPVPVGVLIAAKREPVASLVLHVGVHPDHRRRGHGRHMMTSLSQKMAILEPTLLLVELQEEDALGRRFFEACGFTERDVLTDYTCAGEAPAAVPGVELVAEVPAAELVSQRDLEAVPELDRCWQRSTWSIRNLRDRPRGLAIATDRGFEAWLLHRRSGRAEAPLPFLAGPPVRRGACIRPSHQDSEGPGNEEATVARRPNPRVPPEATSNTNLSEEPLELLAMGGLMPVPALMRPLLAAASGRTGCPLHLPRMHPSEASADRLAEYGFRPGGRTIRYESDATPA